FCALNNIKRRRRLIVYETVWCVAVGEIFAREADWCGEWKGSFSFWIDVFQRKLGCFYEWNGSFEEAFCERLKSGLLGFLLIFM
ncbi:hypothetical protein HMPREF9372_2687, partial [Sporosarcina newyorkensis 2681]